MVEESHLCVRLHQLDCAKICMSIVVPQRKICILIELICGSSNSKTEQIFSSLWVKWASRSLYCKDESFDEMN